MKAKALEDNVEFLTPMPPIGAPGKLTRLGDVRMEMARVYRRACEGKIPFSDATKATFILIHLAKTIQDERDLRVLEAKEPMAIERRIEIATEARRKFVSELRRITDRATTNAVAVPLDPLIQRI